MKLHKSRCSLLSGGLLLALCPLLCFGQSATGPLPDSDAAQPATTSSPAVLSVPATTDQGVETPLDRWLTLDNFSFSGRYRNSAGSNGFHTIDAGQERTLISGKFKFDKAGKYAIGFRESSGKYFNWAYSQFTGTTQVGAQTLTPQSLGVLIRLLMAGAPSPTLPAYQGWALYTRELYLSATPVSFLTAEFGGLGIERGAASEITTFDTDGYLVGERVRVKDKQHLFFDQIVGTFGYFGQLDTPNFFARGGRLNQNNYRQVDVEKKFGKRLFASAQYDWINGLNTVREAARVKVPETRFLDGVRAELYQRTNAVTLQRMTFGGGSGWSISGDRSLAGKRWQIEAGYADIDRNMAIYSGSSIVTAVGFSFNGDAYQIGERLYANVNFTPDPLVTFSGFYTHEINPNPSPLYHDYNKQTIEGAMTLNLKALLTNKLHVL